MIIKAPSSEIGNIINRTDLKLKGAKLEFLESIPSLESDDIALVDVVLREDSFLIGRTPLEIELRNRYNVNLVAVSSKGTQTLSRLKDFRFSSGDILLIQVPVSILQDTYDKLSCLPLAGKNVDINLSNTTKKKQFMPLTLFVIAISLTTIGVFPVQVAFSLTAILLVIFKFITPSEFYDAIEWPSILMLGSLLPLGDALQSSGASDTIANQSNMLVMGPAGYKFTDYWKLGLPLSILIIVIGAPLILYIWPM